MPNANAPNVARINMNKSSKFAIATASPGLCAYGRNVRVPPPVLRFRSTAAVPELLYPETAAAMWHFP
jgi:hypothetical protein